MTRRMPAITAKLFIFFTAVACISARASPSAEIAEKFHDSLISHYTQLFFDLPNNQIIVGARDFLVKLSLRDFSQASKIVHWPATEDASNSCKRKGQPAALCRNFVKVILRGTKKEERKDQVFVCGTNAFSPKCNWRSLNAIDFIVGDWVEGTAKSPSSLTWNTSSLMTGDGEIFYSGPLEFQGNDPEIFRNSDSHDHVMRTVRYDYKWLNTDANFVLSFETRDFVYFIFRESAVEYMNCGKSIYSRIARVCKSDTGGFREQTWTTFLKARLNCSIPGQIPFHFNEIQSAYYNENDGLIYGIFNTPENSIHGSAICAFNMVSVNQTFQGPFKYQPTTFSSWEQKHQSEDLRAQFECKSLGTDYDARLTRSDEQQKYQLMHESVSAHNGRPLVVETLEKFTHIAADMVERRVGEPVQVFFVLTAKNTLRRYIVWPHTVKACLLDEVRITAENDTIYSMKLLKKTNSLYLGAISSVFRVSLSTCDKYTNEEECLHSGDPYCGWNTISSRCAHYPKNYSSDTWIQGRDMSCSDGKSYHWSPWSDWARCNQLNRTDLETCFCRWRQCSGIGCVTSHEQQVSNCTVHGGWSEWMPWSSCSFPCGKAIKTRVRTCTNPVPAFGGRMCAGTPRETVKCPEIACATTTTESPRHLINRHFLWSDWSDWDTCSVPCGGGMQSRKRQCLSPGGTCGGCNVEWRPCNTESCEEVILKTDWTNWYRKNESLQHSGYSEERQKFICRGMNMRGSNDMQITTKKEQRFIELNEKWSECSAVCNGFQFYWTGTEYLKKSCSRICMPCNTHKKDEPYKKYEDDEDLNSLNSDNSAFQRKNKLHLAESVNSTIFLSEITASPPKTRKEVALLVTYCFLSVAVGAGLGSLITYFLLKRKKSPDRKHHRLKSRAVDDSKKSNTYVSNEEFKMNNYNLASTSLLSQSSSSPSNVNFNAPKEATIKRTSTIRAKLTSDQNF